MTLLKIILIMCEENQLLLETYALKYCFMATGNHWCSEYESAHGIYIMGYINQEI